MDSLIPLWFLLIFLGCAAASLLLCALARIFFPSFISGEHKPGHHRSDLVAIGREIKKVDLPLVGGPAFTCAILIVGLLTGYFLHLTTDQWTLLIIGLGATLGFAIVGFVDDWKKVYSNQGLSEKAKFSGVFLVSIAAAICYFFLLPASGQESYSFWKDLPVLNHFLCDRPTLDLVCKVSFPHVSFFAWFIFLVLMIGSTGSLTSLAVDFSDGFDGLAGGLVFSAALAMAIVVTGLLNPHNPHHADAMVLVVLALLCAGATFGYLPWNWPSAWAARRKSSVKRRAKMYMGDCGALGLGGMLAMIAVFSRNEFLLLTTIGGFFVLEGLSVLVSTRILTPFYRRRLQMLRFSHTEHFIHHTEFPLPFLANPLHHHFDLLGWDRRRLVYGAWALGATFACLGVVTGLAPFTWERYLARILALVLMGIIWSSGTWSKCYFVGKHPAERSNRRRLALYYGYPFRLMGIRLFHQVEIIEASEAVIETPAEELMLWQRMSIFDARAMLGLYCYRAGYYPAALTQWTRIPERNRALRPEIVRLLSEVETRLALENQETQPMRREQLQRQQPILAGNLPPADMPNPHEPVSKEETMNEQVSPWSDLVPEREASSS